MHFNAGQGRGEFSGEGQEDGADHRLECADPEGAGDCATHGAKIVGDFAQLVFDPLRTGDEDMTGGGDAGALRGALHEGQADFLFKFADLLGDGRRSEAEDIGGGDDTAVAVDGEEVGESTRINEHSASSVKKN